MIHLQYFKTCQSFLPRQEIIQHQKNYLKSQFGKQLEMMRGFYCTQKKSCTSRDGRIGEYSFCEAIKVDVAESEAEGQKNQLLRSKNQLSGTVPLLRILFEDLGCAIKLHEKFADKITE
jgi:hypothetical protein